MYPTTVLRPSYMSTIPYKVMQQTTDKPKYLTLIDKMITHTSVGRRPSFSCLHCHMSSTITSVMFVIMEQLLHRESKKTRHLTLAHNFTKYWPIFKILSLLDSVGNL